jgi:acetyl esterase/lipase
MATVLCGSEAPEEDVHAALRHLRAEADALGLEMDSLGLFAASGNVTVALSALMRDRHVRCAALLYGYTMDLDGLTAVADMAKQAGFVNACAGKTVNDLPNRAGGSVRRNQRGHRRLCHSRGAVGARDRASRSDS